MSSLLCSLLPLDAENEARCCRNKMAEIGPGKDVGDVEEAEMNKWGGRLLSKSLGWPDRNQSNEEKAIRRIIVAKKAWQERIDALESNNRDDINALLDYNNHGLVKPLS